MSDIQRKLVTVRTIDAINPIDGADAIEVAVIGGWNVVVKKGEFKPTDDCFYFEIDSFLPDGNPAWQFLVDKQGRTFEGQLGHRLRTVKLRGQVSQGFVVPLDALPELLAEVVKVPGNGRTVAEAANADLDLAALAGVKKWEQPLPAELVGQAEGLFPSFMRRTDEERCQNMVNDIFQYSDQKVLIDGLDPAQADQAAILGGRLLIEDGKVYSVRAAKADPDARYEVSLKLDGSSGTYFFRDGEVGVCSRNLQLKVNEANEGNTFVRMLIDGGLDVALKAIGKNIAVQGELMGNGIQGNREQLKEHAFFIFNVQVLDESRYMTPAERDAFVQELYAAGANPKKVFHVPVLHKAVTLQELGITDVKQLLEFAVGPSITHPVREGLVFKRVDGGFSFKAISNVYLAKEKD